MDVIVVVHWWHLVGGHVEEVLVVGGIVESLVESVY